MCVLTYIPIGTTDFILTNNRDETLQRPKAIAPALYSFYGHEVCMPKDALAGGTWIASAKDFTLCLLNGAFEKHIHKPPYKQSRGQIIPDFFQFNSVEVFCEKYNFQGIENFTLVIIEQGAELQIHEIRWDGQQLFRANKAQHQVHIWSSVTLYPVEVREQRASWLATLLTQKPEPTAMDLLDFHLYGGTGDIQNDMRMNRHNELVTQCVVQITYQNQEASLAFYDLLEELKA